MEIRFLEKALHEISPERIECHLDNLAEIGKDSRGGITRLAYTSEECEAFDYLKSQMKGYKITTDPAGNMYFEPPGNDPRNHVTIMGSHLDTVPMGGKYDGTTGVVSALEVLKCIQKYNSQFANNLCVIGFRGEESARFGISLLGSSAVVGEFPYEKMKKVKDKKNITLEQAIKECGLEPERIPEAKINRPVSAFMELHIDQGPILEKEGCPIGIVTYIAAPVRYKLQIQGRYDHSGTTPMDMRKDAGLIGSRIYIMINEICTKVYSKNRCTVGNVGIFRIESESINKVPGKVGISFEVRSTDISERDKTENRIIKGIKKIEQDSGLQIEIERTQYKKPVLLSSQVYDIIRNTCEKRGIRYKMMRSGAGHDAMNMAKMGIPTGMVFVPCRDGRSHCSKEYADISDIVRGTKLLLTTYCSMNNY